MTPPQKHPLRVLFIEDNPDDVELELAALRSNGYVIAHEVVETIEDVREALQREAWDVIICDYWMPEMTGFEALAIARELTPLTPFILVSGTVGEDVAVDAMRAGARDYVLKQNLTRLASAVQRELREAETRRAGHISQIGLRLLADLGAALGRSLDEGPLVREVPGSLVGALGELCMVEVVDERGELRHVASAHVDPDKELLLRQIEEQLASSGPVHARPSSQILLIDDLARAAEPWPAALVRVAAALDLTSALSVPLIAKERLVGAIKLLRRQRYSPLEVQIVEELAGRLAVSIENARLYEQSQRAVQIRDEFLAIASHELRTPLTTVQLKLQGLQRILSKEGPQPSPQRILELGERIDGAVRQLERLADLVERLLDVSGMGAGILEMKIEEVDLGALVRQVVEEQREQAHRSGSEVRLHAAQEAVGWWDRSRLEQVIVNLLSNATKYGSGKPVDVHLECTPTGARIIVSDQGIGIAAEDLERIFARFERAAPVRHYGGLGLGLYLTRYIVEAHGGSIRVVSESGRGATFVVDLPWRAPSRQALVDEAAPTRS